MDANLRYRSPLEARYASACMQEIWSPQRKVSTWRRLWLALAEAQQELGLPITQTQIDELRGHLDDIDFERAAELERSLRHDVMAHIHALGEVAPAARPIIHLGATSQFVGCNTDLILIRESLELVASKVARCIDALGSFAASYRALPTLGFTHYQPAQPTTVGKRATLWAYDLALALEDLEQRLSSLRFRGVKGATGTQASFLKLLGGDHDKVEKLDRLVTEKMGWSPDRRYAVTGQTYPRVVDAQVLASLAATAAAIHKITNDLRLLANRKEIEEPFGADQVGSSTMPYKRNPMLCERTAGLCRFVMTMVTSALATAAAQWFERTLDDSSNRRLTLPEAFLAIDGALEAMLEIAPGLVVYEATIRRALEMELPFLVTEDLIGEVVRRGGDRQAAHETLRRLCQAAGERIKREAAPNDLFERLGAEPAFAGLDLERLADPAAYVGRAPEQVDEFLERVVGPIRRRWGLSEA